MISFESIKFRDKYIIIDEYNNWQCKIGDPDSSNKEEACFKVIPNGLLNENEIGDNKNYISFESASVLNWYLRHRDGKVYLADNDRSESFRSSATWQYFVPNWTI